RELHADGHHVLAFRRQPGIEQRWNCRFEMGFRGDFAVLRGVKRFLEIVDFRSDVDASGERLPEPIRPYGSRERRESRQISEREIHFRDVTLCAEIANAHRKGGIELRRIEELKESPL